MTDTAGETATYTYDAVGNLLAIGRIGATTLSIVEFTPNGGPVGATVTIFGTGFSAVANENTVEFNGTATTVSTATAQARRYGADRRQQRDDQRDHEQRDGHERGCIHRHRPRWTGDHEVSHRPSARPAPP